MQSRRRRTVRRQFASDVCRRTVRRQFASDVCRRTVRRQFASDVCRRTVRRQFATDRVVLTDQARPRRHGPVRRQFASDVCRRTVRRQFATDRVVLTDQARPRRHGPVRRPLALCTLVARAEWCRQAQCRASRRSVVPAVCRAQPRAGRNRRPRATAREISCRPAGGHLHSTHRTLAGRSRRPRATAPRASRRRRTLSSTR